MGFVEIVACYLNQFIFHKFLKIKTVIYVGGGLYSHAFPTCECYIIMIYNHIIIYSTFTHVFELFFFGNKKICYLNQSIMKKFNFRLDFLIAYREWYQVNILVHTNLNK